METIKSPELFIRQLRHRHIEVGRNVSWIISVCVGFNIIRDVNWTDQTWPIFVYDLTLLDYFL